MSRTIRKVGKSKLNHIYTYLSKQNYPELIIDELLNDLGYNSSSLRTAETQVLLGACAIAGYQYISIGRRCWSKIPMERNAYHNAFEASEYIFCYPYLMDDSMPLIYYIAKRMGKHVSNSFRHYKVSSN